MRGPWLTSMGSLMAWSKAMDREPFRWTPCPGGGALAHALMGS